MKKYTPDSILDAGWFAERENGLEWDGIQALGIIAVGLELRRLRSVMNLILGNMQSLGGDGIHEVIKNEAARIRRAKKVAANRRKRARAAKAAKVSS